MEEPVKVYELMRTGFLAVRPESSSESCCERFAVHHVGCAPVVEDQNELVGFVTRHDLYWGQRKNIKWLKIVFDRVVPSPENASLTEIAVFE